MNYARNCDSYMNIASDNKAFLTDYEDISLYKKLPLSYQQLSHNYGTLEYKDLDPRLVNLFDSIPVKPKVKKRQGGSTAPAAI